MSALLKPTPIPPTYTARDLERLSVDGLRYELIRGELFEMSPASFQHGTITMRLAARATVYAEDNNLGLCTTSETGFLISSNPDTVLAPDWAFVSNERLSGVVLEGYLPLAPDLVLETRSPNDTTREVALKVDRWLQAGVKIVWELNPGTAILAVHRLGAASRFLKPSDTLTGEDVLPGFELPLSKLFPKA
jgi:Uma2 family endonuclease